MSHITPLEVTLSCRPRQHESDGTGSAGPMYSTVIFAGSDASHNAFVESALLFCKQNSPEISFVISPPHQMFAKIYCSKM